MGRRAPGALRVLAGADWALAPLESAAASTVDGTDRRQVCETAPPATVWRHRAPGNQLKNPSSRTTLTGPKPAYASGLAIGPSACFAGGPVYAQGSATGRRRRALQAGAPRPLCRWALQTDARQGGQHARSHPPAGRAQLRVHRRCRHGLSSTLPGLRPALLGGAQAPRSAVRSAAASCSRPRSAAARSRADSPRAGSARRPWPRCWPPWRRRPSQRPPRSRSSSSSCASGYRRSRAACDRRPTLPT